MARQTTPEQRRSFYQRHLQDRTYQEIADHEGVSKECVRYWCRRQRDGGTIQSRYRRVPAGLLSRFGPKVRYGILRLRLEHPRWDPNSIHAKLRKRSSLRGLPLPSESSIGRYLHQWKRFRRRSRKEVQRERPKQPVRVHQRWQIDFKLEIPLQDGSLVNLCTIRDPLGAVCIGAFVFPAGQTGKRGRRVSFEEVLYGWTYISARAGLLGLLLIFAAFNFVTGLINPLIMPMILDMTSADVLGFLVSIVGVGMLVGILVMSAWGGPKRRIHGVLGFLMLSGFFTSLLGVSPLIPVMAVAGFFLMFTMPIINGSSQAIWQSKVDPDVQGRVFSIRRMIAWSMTPLAYIVAGPLADRVFRPLLLEGGALADSVGQLIGVGSGRGTGLMFIVVGAVSILVAGVGYLNPHVRNIEDELPDAMPSPESSDDSEAPAGEKVEPEPVMSQAD